MNSPIAQDSAAQSPGQVSDPSLFQRAGENMVQKCPESPWLASELERFYQDDLDDVLPSPVQERSLQEDVILQAKTELKHHDSAINKHLVKKAALEEKSKPWQLGSAVSSNIVDSDGCAVGRFQTEPAVEKRIRELEEASKRQDLAIQKHNTKKAVLERGMKRNLDYEPGQPSKKPVFEAAEEDTLVSMPGEHLSKNKRARKTKAAQKKRPAQNSVKSNAESLMLKNSGDFSVRGSSIGLSPNQPYDSRLTNSTVEPSSPLTEMDPIALLYHDHSMTAEASSRRAWDSEDFMSTFSLENYRIGSTGDQATSGDTVHEPPRQIPFKEIIEQREYASEGPASSGRSFTHWLLRRRPSSFGSVMNGMFKKFERVAIGVGSARKSRDKEAVPVEDSVNK